MINFSQVSSEKNFQCASIPKKFLHYLKLSSFSGPEMFEIQQGRFGDNVPLSIIYDLAEEHYIMLDDEGYEQIIQKRRVHGYKNVFYDQYFYPCI